MRLLRFMLAIALPIFSLAADTIVLKNGRRISATKVIEENGKVSFETEAGVFSLPASIVERVERGPAIPTQTPKSRAVGEIEVAPPQFEILVRDETIARRVLRGGSIDREYVAQLEADALSGSLDAIAAVVAAHHSASEHEVVQGDLERAIAHCRRALSFAPEHLGLLLNTSYLHLRRSEFTGALTYLERARRIAPDSPDVAKLFGWSYYGLNRLDRAVTEWKRAIALRPDADIQPALEKAIRDLATEESFLERESLHFRLWYNGAAAPFLARDVLRVLEAHFRTIEAQLNYSPPESIGVILYTNREFADITSAPAWVGAINDGRIRLPVQGLSAVTTELNRVLKHELVHSFLQQKTRGRCPVWLQEGIAQWIEGSKSGHASDQLLDVDRRGAIPQLASLEGTWMQLPADHASVAYIWSLALVESIIANHGFHELNRILDFLMTEPSAEAAVRRAIRSSYQDLERDTMQYLRRTYQK